MFVCNFVCICVIARAHVYLHARVYYAYILCVSMCDSSPNTIIYLAGKLRYERLLCINCVM